MRAAPGLQASGSSLWPLWLEDLDLGKLPLQRVENLRVFPRVHSLNIHVLTMWQASLLVLMIEKYSRVPTLMELPYF